MATDSPQAPAKSNPSRKQLEFATSDDLQKLLVEIFESPEYRPPVFPNVALEVAALTRRPNASIEEFVAALQKDPLIVASVLKLAQSALYGSRPQSLQNALQRLGMNTLRDIVWQVAASQRLFNVQGYMPLMNRVRTHSIYCAHASRMIAIRAGLAAEHAFLCGLLHDMGISGTLIALAEAGNPPPPLTMLMTAIDAVHERAGEAMASMWRLAPEIGGAIRYHHQYEPDVAHVPVLSAVICVADDLAEQNGYGVSVTSSAGSRNVRFDVQAPFRLEHALKRLRLQNKLDDLASRGKELAEQLRPLMNG
ncbi:MAG TPA: HDOD domain-containing protein [Polyangiales bacterium]|nr:HDOD domain-containing protein [Polyangiales bacterium]